MIIIILCYECGMDFVNSLLTMNGNKLPAQLKARIVPRLIIHALMPLMKCVHLNTIKNVHNS